MDKLEQYKQGQQAPVEVDLEILLSMCQSVHEDMKEAGSKYPDIYAKKYIQMDSLLDTIVEVKATSQS